MEIVAPEEAGFSSERLLRVDSLMRRYVDDGRLAGTVTLLARGGRVFHFKKHGLAEIQSGRPMDVDTIFRIHSMTKPVTSVAVMMLQEEGNFQLDDPVSKLIPELDALKVCIGTGRTGLTLVDQQHPITIRQLLTHTAGLTYGFLRDTPVYETYRQAALLSPESSLKEMIGKLGQLPLAYQPGSEWRYSVATDVLGYLVEVVSGMPLDRFLEERVFQPLDMKDTGFYVSREKLDRLASVYGPVQGGGIQKIDDEQANQVKRPPTMLSGGGGLVGTASDYFRFCQMMLGGGALDSARLLAPETVDFMTMNHLPDELIPFSVSPILADFTRGCGFGLGFKVVTDVAQYGTPASNGAYSWGGAASTVFWVDPNEALIAILMTQFMPAGHYPIWREFEVATYEALLE